MSAHDDPSERPERGDATRAALLSAARALFAERGYAGVGTEEVVRRAGVTRRALYEQTEQEIVASIGARMTGIADPVELLVEGVRAFLDACGDPVLMRIGLR